jgi:hypothetical protein
MRTLFYVLFTFYANCVRGVPRPAKISSEDLSNMLIELTAVNRSAIPNIFNDSFPSCDLPVYDLDQWIRINGNVYPDHPAIFQPSTSTTHGNTAYVLYKKREAFLSKFGNQTVQTEPGYTQAGGHLGHLKISSRVGE